MVARRLPGLRVGARDRRRGARRATSATVVAAQPDVGVVAGGATRAESVANALAAVETELVAIHDAARPLLTPALVEALVADLEADARGRRRDRRRPRHRHDQARQPRVAESRGSAFCGRRTGQRNRGTLAVGETLDRGELWRAQTPQVFRTDALREALAVDAATRDAATDEAMLVERAGGAVLIHPCEGENLKVTTPADLRLAELLLARAPATPAAVELCLAMRD